MALYITSLVSLVLAALSLGPSFAHVLEAPPRIIVWSAELWREATVFNGQFALFAKVGAPLDVGTILATGLLAYLLSAERPTFWLALGAASLWALSLATWFMWVAAANAVLATWQPGPIASDFDQIRLRWETGHMAVTCIKAVGFLALCLAVLMPRLPGTSAV